MEHDGIFTCGPTLGKEDSVRVHVIDGKWRHNFDNWSRFTSSMVSDVRCLTPLRVLVVNGKWRRHVFDIGQGICYWRLVMSRVPQWSSLVLVHVIHGKRHYVLHFFDWKWRHMFHNSKGSMSSTTVSLFTGSVCSGIIDNHRSDNS